MVNLTRIRFDSDLNIEIEASSTYKDYYRFKFFYRNNLIEGGELWDKILNVPSTNGLYVIEGLDGYQSTKKTRYLFATDEFMKKLYNDEFINTMSADPKCFYRGKHVNAKVFVRKLLERPLGLVKHASVKIKSLNDSIDALDLSMRSYNTLKRANLTKIESLLSLTFEEIKGTKNLGQKSADEIREKLLERGYKLKPSVIRIPSVKSVRKAPARKAPARKAPARKATRKIIKK